MHVVMGCLITHDARGNNKSIRGMLCCQTAETTINKSLIEDLLGTFLLVQHLLSARISAAMPSNRGIDYYLQDMLCVD